MVLVPPGLSLLQIPACLPHRLEASRNSPINVNWEDLPFGSLSLPPPIILSNSSTSHGLCFNDLMTSEEVFGLV